MQYLILIVFAWGIVSTTRFTWRFVGFPLWIVFNVALLSYVGLFHDCKCGSIRNLCKAWFGIYMLAIFDPDDIDNRWKIEFPDGHKIDWLVRL